MTKINDKTFAKISLETSDQGRTSVLLHQHTCAFVSGLLQYLDMVCLYHFNDSSEATMN